MSEPVSLLPEVLKAAQTVFKSLNNRLTTRLGTNWPPGPGASIIKTVQSFFADNLIALGDHPFGLRIDPSRVGALGPLTATRLREALAGESGTILFTVDTEFRIIETMNLLAETEAKTWLDVMQDESVSHPVFFFEQPNCVRVCAGRSLVDEFVPSTGEKAGRFNRFSRRAVNYREAIREHYEQWVKHETGCYHWEKPKDRVLKKKAPPAKKTEEIFQRSLIQWLDVAITDANVWPEPEKSNGDRADIKIAFLGGFYLIEVKWMGTSGGRPLTLARVRDGIKQLAQYIEQRPKPSHATLVVYDARSEKAFAALSAVESPAEGMKRLAECGGIKVPPGGCCFVFFLYSQRASEL